MAEEKPIGKITHYFGNINVGIIELSDELKVGDKVSIRSGSSEFEQVIDSMQIDHQNVDTTKAGDAVGIKVAQKVKENDEVFKVL